VVDALFQRLDAVFEADFAVLVPEEAGVGEAGAQDALTALRGAGVEVFYAEGVDGGRLKSCYTRDPFIMVKGGAIVCRMGARIRRGEELAITRTLAKIGIPILRTISGTGVMEGGSFAWINSSTAAIGVGVRVNRDGALQVAEVLKRQGVELLIVELTGYDIHLDVSFLMVDKDLALVNPFGLPHSFMEELKARGVRLVEIEPADDPWINNSLAIAPGLLLTATIAATGAGEIWVTHGQEDALVHWCATQGLKARPLDIVGYGDEDDENPSPQGEGEGSGEAEQ